MRWNTQRRIISVIDCRRIRCFTRYHQVVQHRVTVCDFSRDNEEPAPVHPSCREGHIFSHNPAMRHYTHVCMYVQVVGESTQQHSALRCLSHDIIAQGVIFFMMFARDDSHMIRKVLRFCDGLRLIQIYIKERITLLTDSLYLGLIIRMIIRYDKPNHTRFNIPHKPHARTSSTTSTHPSRPHTKPAVRQTTTLGTS